MDRGASAEPLSWLAAPAAGILLASALSLPQQPYSGIALRGDEVMAVVTGSPAERAGLAVGDRLSAPHPSTKTFQGPLAEAEPREPLPLVRRRGQESSPVVLVPTPLPQSERRMMAALFAVASGFVLLGSWVWSERRDRLTRPFYMLCLAFAALLAPPPRLPWPAAAVTHELLYTAATLALPALCIHFFALFPEPRPQRGGRAPGVSVAYAVAGLLFAGWALALGLGHAGLPVPARSLDTLQAAAAVWFAGGLLAAVGLFLRSYLRAGSVDARRRLGVAQSRSRGRGAGGAPRGGAHPAGPALAHLGHRNPSHLRLPRGGPRRGDRGVARTGGGRHLRRRRARDGDEPRRRGGLWRRVSGTHRTR